MIVTQCDCYCDCDCACACGCGSVVVVMIWVFVYIMCFYVCIHVIYIYIHVCVCVYVFYVFYTIQFSHPNVLIHVYKYVYTMNDLNWVHSHVGFCMKHSLRHMNRDMIVRTCCQSAWDTCTVLMGFDGDYGAGAYIVTESNFGVGNTWESRMTGQWPLGHAVTRNTSVWRWTSIIYQNIETLLESKNRKDKKILTETVPAGATRLGRVVYPMISQKLQNLHCNFNSLSLTVICDLPCPHLSYYCDIQTTLSRHVFFRW